MKLSIQGKVLTSQKALEKYSRDESPYRVKPKIITIPKNASDLVEIVNYSKHTKMPIIARGAGSNVSGSAIGKGIIVDFQNMNSILKVSKNIVTIQPGLYYDALNKKMARQEVFLPYSPSSGSFSTIGGNVSTKASGLRGLKYGSIDNYVTKIKFVDSEGRLIDTDKPPEDYIKKILNLKKKLLGNKKILKILKNKRKLKTSSGYNIQAFLKYKKPSDILTHLLVGSLGTLGLIYEIELKLVKIPKKTMTSLAFFNNLDECNKVILKTKKMNASAIEIMDNFSLNLLKNPVFSIPENTRAALLIEFDEKLNKNIKTLEKLLSKHSQDYIIEESPLKQKKLWDFRKSILYWLNKSNKKFIAIVEDIGVPPEKLSVFIKDIHKFFKKNKIDAVIYGHAGDGNLHIRTAFQKRNFHSKLNKVAKYTFSLVFKYNGTITAEHGVGRNKSPFLKKEWGLEIYSFFKEIKQNFDRKKIFNPGILFTTKTITKDLD